jgi:acetyltransferase
MSDIESPSLRNAAKLSYPARFRTTEIMKDGSQILVRPIQPDDAPLLVELFNRLSKATIFFRFFSDMKEIPQKLLHNFVTIDYTRDVVMAGVREHESRREILGVCRIMCHEGPTRGELAVAVDDLWQGKGLGPKLMRRAISIARELGMETVCGIVSAENKRFLAVAKKLGFSTKLSSEPGFVEIEMNLAAYR